MRHRIRKYREPSLGWGFRIFLIILHLVGVPFGMWLARQFLD